MIWLLSQRQSVARAWLLSLVFAGVLSPAATAQIGPTPEQLQILQGLTPEQQAVFEQSGGQRASGEAASSASVRTQGVSDVASARRRAGVEDSTTVGTGVLAPNDIVAVELALPGMMAKGSVRAGGVQDPSAETAPRRIRSPPDMPLSAAEQKRLGEMIAQVLANNPYRLDRTGHLNLPGFAPIQVSGLNEQQAVQLLSLEGSMLNLDVSLSRLPVARTGVEALKPFGYDLFDETTSAFLPVTDGAVPTDYVVGPGDVFNVQLYGGQSRNHRLEVSREGSINFPELGPIRVSGQRFSAAKLTIESRVSQQLIGVRADVSMGEMRTIRVFVFGEVRQQGSYTVSGLATMTTALFASGGVKAMGSLRDIQLKRQGVVVRRLDLYDLLIRGDTSDDAMLQPGDVIFIPTAGPTVSVDGEVKRPAIYELRGETSTAELLQMAGGLSSEADPLRSSITRVDEQYRHVILNVDFSKEDGRSRLLRNGDVLRVARLRPQLDSGVVLEGFVYRSGPVAWREGLRLTDVIGSIDELKPNADMHYILIWRESGADRKVEARSADLVAALAQPGGAADIVLMPRDRIIVFDLATGRERIIKPLLDELRLQSGLARPTEVVSIEGRVKVPGEYPLEVGMKVSDLLRAGGNLDAAAFGGMAELARREVSGDGTRQTKLIEVDIAAVLRGDSQANVALHPFDILSIKETPEWIDQESVTLSGEVRFPGTYPIRRGETVYGVLQRAGGLTPRAFARGSALTRVSSREREQKQLDLLAERMRSELASLSLQAAAANQEAASKAFVAGQSLLTQLNSSRAVGRLIIDLEGLLAEGRGSSKDVILRHGDLLIVPPQTQEVTVIGEVQVTTSHLYRSSLKRDDYIAKSGGVTRKADMKKVYVVRADGSVLAQRGGLLSRRYDVAIQPGDTIVVPFDTERMPRLPFWQAVTQIIYNLAVSVAAVNSF